MATPLPLLVQDLEPALNSQEFDALILISPNGLSTHAALAAHLDTHAAIDQRLGQEAVLVAAGEVPGNRLISVPAGDVEWDYADVRHFGDAAKQGVLMAKRAGAQRPLLMLEGVPDTLAFQHALATSFLAATQALWQPLEARETLDEQAIEPVQHIGLVDVHQELDLAWVNAVSQGLRVARDLCGTEPERMAPPKFAEYCEQAFAGTDVKVTVRSDYAQLQQDYPLLCAVARASMGVERHHPRVIRLEYTGEGPIEKTLLFSGKGIVYDTGGADLKTDGHMAGMSRDKGGAAGVAGFVKAVAQYKPKGLKVIAEIAAVRNSIGEDAFVTDEIIKARTGVRVRIGNTDAEGRLVMADLLAQLKDEALDEVNPELFTVATLTGHAARAVGPYTALVENGPARAAQVARNFADNGELYGDPSEVSRSRREDWNFVKPRTSADDLLSSNNAASAVTARGHQFPMAFLAIASGLDKHGSKAEKPLPYMHIDIAGSGVEHGDWQHDSPTGVPVIALAATYMK